MIADDDSAILALLSYTFESDGFKVSLVKNGLEALDLASKRDFDVILLDMMMPELSGLAVTEALRQRANSYLNNVRGRIHAACAPIRLRDFQAILQRVRPGLGQLYASSPTTCTRARAVRARVPSYSAHPRVSATYAHA